MIELSASSVAQYLSCRRRFRWSQIWQPPAIHTPVALWFGKTAHRGFELMLQGASAADAWRQAEREEWGSFPGTPEAEEARSLGPQVLNYLWEYLQEYLSELEFCYSETPFRFQLREGVVFSGRFDAIAKHPDGIYVVDLKFVSQFRGGWDRDPQMTAYYWAARKVYGDKLAGVLVLQVKKKLPDPPAIRADGHISTNRWQQRTSYLVARRVVRETYEVDVPLAVREWLYWLREQPDPVVRPEYLWRSLGQLQSWERYMTAIAEEIASPTTFWYPNPGWHCSTCPFSGPCLALDDGDEEAAMEMLESYVRVEV